MSAPVVISVAGVEDEPEIRECLEILIDQSPGYRCTGAFRTMERALERLAADLPDVALVDIGLPGMSGIEG